MTKLKSGDFIEIEYTGRLENNAVFDATDEAVAKREGIHNAQAVYGSRVVCLGQNMLLRGLDAFLQGKEPGAFAVDLAPEQAFGKKDAKLIQLVPTKSFAKENITPFPGMQVHVDGTFGVIKTVTGGRTLVDFNHPLAGKAVHYEIKVVKTVIDPAIKVKAVVENSLPVHDVKVEVNDSKAIISFPKPLPKEMHQLVEGMIKKLVDIEVSFA